jgi:hypothetical protein
MTKHQRRRPPNECAEQHGTPGEYGSLLRRCVRTAGLINKALTSRYKERGIAREPTATAFCLSPTAERLNSDAEERAGACRRRMNRSCTIRSLIELTIRNRSVVVVRLRGTPVKSFTGSSQMCPTPVVFGQLAIAAAMRR